MKHLQLKNGEVLVEGKPLGKPVGDGEEKVVYAQEETNERLISVMDESLHKTVLNFESFRQESIDSPNEVFKADFHFRKLLQVLFPKQISTEYLVTNLEENGRKKRVREIQREELGEHHIRVENWRERGMFATPEEDESILYQEALAENSELMSELKKLGVKFDKYTHNLTDAGVYLDRIPAFVLDKDTGNWIKNYDQSVLVDFIKNKLSEKDAQKAFKKLNRIESLFHAVSSV